MRALRSILSVIAGFAVMAAIVVFLTPRVARYFRAEDFRTINVSYMLANLGYSSVAAILAGFVTAWIAGYKELRHASALGFLMIVMSFVSMRIRGEHQPGWYEVVIGGVGPIAAMLGAAIRMLAKGKSTS